MPLTELCSILQAKKLRINSEFIGCDRHDDINCCLWFFIHIWFERVALLIYLSHHHMDNLQVRLCSDRNILAWSSAFCDPNDWWRCRLLKLFCRAIAMPPLDHWCRKGYLQHFFDLTGTKCILEGECSKHFLTHECRMLSTELKEFSLYEKCW